MTTERTESGTAGGAARHDDGFGPIGICMSGGGYRAAAFHLGTLAYLDRVGLGDEIRQMSTVSGGTFIGMSLTLAQIEGKPFERFFADFYGFLQKTDLVQLGLARLGGPPPQTPSGRHDLIVAMADTYATTFLKRADGSPYRFGDVLDADIRLTDAIFNATEFRHGIAFRFQRTESKNAPIGNARLRIPRDAAAQIRVADIVAASSCFPGGFEPLAFPFDFSWPGGRVPEVLEKQFTTDGKRTPVGLMDGGVYDNQGAESLLLADGRDPDRLGLFILSDVDQRSDDLFPYPTGGDPGGPTLGRLNAYLTMVLTVCVASVVMILLHAFREYRTDGLDFGDILVYLVPSVLVGLVSFAIFKGRSVVRDQVLPAVPQVGLAAWDDLKRLRLGQVIEMAQLRVSSLLAMSSSIFMKRIRGLVYGLVYRDPRYQRSRVSNLVYHLASGSSWPSELPDEVPETSAALRRVADVAAGMPTTLWFDHATPYQQPCLVATGQATLCFNLMKRLVRTFGKDPATYPPHAAALWERLITDWKVLCDDPYALLAERLGKASPYPPTA